MAPSLTKWLIVSGVLLFLLLTLLSATHSARKSQHKFHSPEIGSIQTSIRECLGGTALSIATLSDSLVTLRSCNNVQARAFAISFDRMYDVSVSSGSLTLPDQFKSKVLKWLGNNEDLLAEVSDQYITTMFNVITHEAAVLNPLRAKRPGVTAAGAEEYITKVIDETKGDCDFCNYKIMTAADTFGRIESQHAVTAANTFKYDGAHGLILFRHHDPIHWTEAEFVDVMETSLAWFARAHQDRPSLLYPHLMWDILPKASASQIHPHAQVTLAERRYYGFGEHLRVSAAQFEAQFSEPYFSSLVHLHDGLGLAYNYGGATAIAYLTARKDWEVMVLSPEANLAFHRLLHFVLRAFIDDLKLYSLSIAMFYPAMSDTVTSLPAMARIVDRGPSHTVRSDISAMELFAESNVNVDPFRVAARVRQYLEKHLH